MELSCPQCQTELDIDARRWSGLVLCPCCNTKLLYDFDFTWDEESGDEWDHPQLILLAGSIYENSPRQLDRFKCKIAEADVTPSPEA